MDNLVVWLVALGIGAVVAGATFLVAARGTKTYATAEDGR
jgi:hypothetical protein